MLLISKFILLANLTFSATTIPVSALSQKSVLDFYFTIKFSTWQELQAIAFDRDLNLLVQTIARYDKMTLVIRTTSAAIDETDSNSGTFSSLQNIFYY